MATLDQEIARLKNEIEGYVAKLAEATTEKELLKLYTSLITARSETLNRLLDEKRALSIPAGMNLVGIFSWYFDHMITTTILMIIYALIL